MEEDPSLCLVTQSFVSCCWVRTQVSHNDVVLRHFLLLLCVNVDACVVDGDVGAHRYHSSIMYVRSWSFEVMTSLSRKMKMRILNFRIYIRAILRSTLGIYDLVPAGSELDQSGDGN